MSIKLEHTVVINRSVEDVFAFITDVSRLPQWSEKTVEAAQTSTGPVAIGTTCRITNSAMGYTATHDLAVSEYEPNSSYAARSVSGPFPMSLRYEVEAVSGGTRLRATSEADIGGFAMAFGPLINSIVKKQFISDHQRLKELLESTP